MTRRMVVTLRIIAVVGLLYAFLTSIGLMGKAFKLFGGGFADELIGSCSNPFTGLFIGILATSLIQSSSTTTSIVVGFVGTGQLPVAYSIPIIMGANIGTSITCTLVSLTFVTRRADFRRAFSAATVHDFFNVLSVLVFFPLELKFHIIEKVAHALTRVFAGSSGATFTSPVKVAIDPAVNGIKHFFLDTLGMTNVGAGVVMVVIAITVLIASLAYLVKTMKAIVIAKAESVIDKYLFRNDMTAFALGLCLTAVIQSSSVTTSLIVPLVAAGILTLDRCYPVTLGANIGTTCTALLASMAGETAMGVTAAFAHLTFNVFGIAVFYPLRRIPIRLAERFSALASRSKKWVAIFVIGLFFVFPLVTILLTRHINWRTVDVPHRSDVQNEQTNGGSNHVERTDGHVEER